MERHLPWWRPRVSNNDTLLRCNIYTYACMHASMHTYNESLTNYFAWIACLSTQNGKVFMTIRICDCLTRYYTGYVIMQVTEHVEIQPQKRATFETPKYPRRPRDQWIGPEMHLSMVKIPTFFGGGRGWSIYPPPPPPPPPPTHTHTYNTHRKLSFLLFLHTQKVKKK